MESTYIRDDLLPKKISANQRKIKKKKNNNFFLLKSGESSDSRQRFKPGAHRVMELTLNQLWCRRAIATPRRITQTQFGSMLRGEICRQMSEVVDSIDKLLEMAAVSSSMEQRDIFFRNSFTRTADEEKNKEEEDFSIRVQAKCSRIFGTDF